MKNKKIFVYVTFMIIMIGLGVNDALRGIFASVFEQGFQLTKAQVSLIITVSYVGNMVFLLFGSRMADKYAPKKVCCFTLILWMMALAIYCLTENYVCLLVGMFISMGASTLMNTMINILTPAFFGVGAGMLVNTLFFIQGIGTSGSQNIVGGFATSYHHFKLVNIVLFIMAAIGLVMIMTLQFPTQKQEKKELKSGKNQYIKIIKNPAFIFLTLAFGFYFIAEHGILNWWAMYCNQYMGLEQKTSALSLSLFFGGITIGRLIFSPFVSKLGVNKAIAIFGGIGTVLYVIGIVGGNYTMMVLSISGVFVSILYPTMVLMVQNYFTKDVMATVTGLVISVSSLFDIIFNAVFGSMIDALGFGTCIYIFPVSMLCFYSIYLVFQWKCQPIVE